MILYIHPKTDMTLEEIVPVSLPALVKRVADKHEVRGCFYNEWTRKLLARADAVLMDVHWYSSIPGARQLAAALKAANPRVPIIAGGAAATMFARQLLRDTRIDFIVRGDAERPLAMLINALLEQKSAEAIPNVESRDFVSPNWYCLTQEDFDDNDYRDISWFPTLDRRVRWLHRWGRGCIYMVHPVLLPFRGCSLNCGFCLGSNVRQRLVFRRDGLFRNPERVRDDLIAYSADSGLKFVSVFHDFLTIPPPPYPQTVLDRRYDLDLRMEFTALPSRENLELLLQSFRGGKLCFSLDQLHATSDVLPDIDSLIDRIRQAQQTGRFDVFLSYIHALVQSDARYAAAFQKVCRATKCRPDRVDTWWDFYCTPDAEGYATEEDYQTALDNVHRYYEVNRIFRMTVYAQAIAPRLTTAILRQLSTMNFGFRAKKLKPDPHRQEEIR